MLQFKLEKIKEYLEENLRKGFIIQSNAPYDLPILFIVRATIQQYSSTTYDVWRMTSTMYNSTTRSHTLSKHVVSK